MIERRLHELVHSIAAAFGATATLKYERVYPATINHDARGGVRRATSPTRWSAPRTSCATSSRRWASEDFSFMLQAQPGRVRAAGAGRRRRRLLPAQQPLRLQRRGDSARRGLSRRAGRARAAADAGLTMAMRSRRHFAATYGEARAKFLAAAARGAARGVSRHVHPARARRRRRGAVDRRRAARRAPMRRALLRGDRRARTASRASAARGMPGRAAARRRRSRAAIDARRRVAC